MEDIKEYINRHRSSKEKSKDFVSYLYELMDKHGFEKNSDVYNKTDISRQAWHNIISERYQPSLSFCLKVAFVLQLDNHECKYLLKKAGYTLAASSIYSLIIRYCIENKIYDVEKVNDYLIEYGYSDQLI